MTALSPLQKFLLKECLDSAVTKRSALKKFYVKQSNPPKAEDPPRLRSAKRREAGQQNAITKSLERLVDRGYMVGFGRRTPKKWYIEGVRLTPVGRRVARNLLGKQQQIPFTHH
ncbi:MAG: hypothetical protein Q8O51_00850 [bacterium]|nr:hypothetical protein [bacterium]